MSKYMGKVGLIGYLGLDFVRNGLEGVTKMIDVLGKTERNVVN